MRMNQPKFIQPGDRIAWVAPSFGVTTEPYETRAAVAKKQWEKMGYQVEEGATGELRIKVNRESGTLDISVVSSDGTEQSFYRGKDIPTSDFTVNLTAPGEYKVLIEAKDFAGDYSFLWGTRQVKQ